MAFVATDVLRIFHHVVHTLHLRAHLYDFLASAHHLAHRRDERPHESLEGHEHTNGEFALQDEDGSEDKDGGVDETLYEDRNDTHANFQVVGIVGAVELLRP